MGEDCQEFRNPKSEIRNAAGMVGGIPNSSFLIPNSLQADLFKDAVERFKLPASGIEVGRKSHAALSHRYHDPPFEKPASGVGWADARVAGGDNACDRVSRAR